MAEKDTPNGEPCNEIPGEAPLQDWRFHGRRHGRRLRAGMEQLLRDWLPVLQMTLPPGDGEIVPDALFPGPVSDLWMEIGFGAGEHFAWQVEHNPEVGLIGCEPFMNGVASLMRHLEGLGRDPAALNVRILADDVRPMLKRLAPGSFGRICVLFPDPWPKTRHAERRIIQNESVAQLRDLLRPGGELRLATDDMNYARWMLQRLTAHQGLRWLARRPGDWRDRPEDWPATRYENKAVAVGRRPAFLRFVRVD